MAILRFVLVASMAAVLAGCSSPQEKAAKAQEESAKAQTRFTEERLKLVERYKKCVENAKGDKMTVESCEHYLKAIEAMQ